MNDKTGSIVAGLRVTSGYMKVADQGSKEEYIFKLLRKGSIIEEKMTAKALKRFKDDVLQVIYRNMRSSMSYFIGSSLTSLD